MAQGRLGWQQVRIRITELLTNETHCRDVEPTLHRIDDVRLLQPFAVADYVDFYASDTTRATLAGRPGRIRRR